MRKKGTLRSFFAIFIAVLIGIQGMALTALAQPQLDAEIQTEAQTEAELFDDEPEYPYLDTGLTFEERAVDLVSRMTSEEKYAQLRARTAPAIPRLGIRAYDWWSEALHGVARDGTATSFPTGLGIAATWDTELVQKIMSATSDEAREKFNNQDNTHGLSYYSPTINLSRDPRWGRAEEAYGEDPYLTAQIGNAFIRGLQGEGENETYMKAIATAKHFAANNSEQNRHSGSSDFDERTLREYYTYAFKSAVEDANVGAIMTSYNSVNGVPSSTNTLLLDTLLRRTWGFDGYVTTDCWAIRDIVNNHKWRPDDWATKPAWGNKEATAFVMKTGVDLNCGNVMPENAGAAIEAGLMTEDDVDIALVRLFTARMKTGEFDPEEMVSYANLDEYGRGKQVHAQDHTALAEDSSDKAVVLLKNEVPKEGTAPLLPLDASELQNIVVVGHRANAFELGDYSTYEPKHTSTPLQGIEAALKRAGSDATLTYIAGGQGSGGQKNYQMNSANFEICDKDGNKLRDIDLKTASETGGGCQVEKGNNPVNIGYCSSGKVNWVKFDEIDFTDAQKIKLQTAGDSNAAPTTIELRLGSPSGTIMATAYGSGNTGGWGKYEQHEVDFTDGGFGQKQENVYIVIRNTPESSGLTEAEKKTIAEADVVIAYADTKPGENGYYEDRDGNNLDLPNNQTGLIMDVAKLNPNTVVYMQAVSQINVEPFKNLVPSILWCTYNGQAQGNALGRLIFGESNPSAKLPFTWYTDVDQLDNVKVYTIRSETEDGSTGSKGRTYQYFTGDITYPFGYGLSYSEFEYDNLKLSTSNVTPNDTIKVEFDVTNTSDVPGAEAAQVYVVSPGADKVDRPAKRLKGFDKQEIAPRATVHYSIDIPVADLWYWDEENMVEAFDEGEYIIQVGADASDCEDMTAKFTLTGQKTPTLTTVTAIPTGHYMYADKPYNTISTKLSATRNDQTFVNLDNADGVTVVYSSSNTDVAAVDENGVVTAMGEGIATITATVTEGGASHSSSYAVMSKPSSDEYDPYKIPQSRMTATASSEEISQSKDGAQNILDGNPGTMWHTNWNAKTPPYWLQIDLDKAYNIDHLALMPRQSGDNGRFTSYKLLYKKTPDGEWNVLEEKGTLEDSSREQDIYFDTVSACAFRFENLDGKGGFASLAEFNAYSVDPDETEPEAPADLSGTQFWTGEGDPADWKPGVKLSWSAVSGAAKYFIYRDSVMLWSTTSTTYTDNAVARDGKYTYEICAIGTNGVFGEKAELSMTISTPVIADEIRLDGRLLKGFDPQTLNYEVMVTALPTVTATAPAGMTVDIVQPTDKTLKATVTVSMGEAKAVYVINFEIAPETDQMVNPYLPLWEHIPDGEPHVFQSPVEGEGMRVYIYGSHDSNRNGYCGPEYVTWSAPVDDLSKWRYEGQIYSCEDNGSGKHNLFAPDVAYKDGTYYLYVHDWGGDQVIRVATSDSPTGPFTYEGTNHNDATMQNPGESQRVDFDPAVFVDDDGKAYAYWGYVGRYAGFQSGELEDDMKTIKKGTQTSANIAKYNAYDGSLDPSGFYYYEAASVRKIDDKYVLVYSIKPKRNSDPGVIHDNYRGRLAYAYSDSPLGDWTYGGVIIDNGGELVSDGVLSYKDGNNHGSIVEIDGQWYVFYHRMTKTDENARQAMMEPINVRVEGDKVIIDQAEMTSQGANTNGLDAYRKQDAGIACYLTGGAYVTTGYLENPDYNPIVNLKNGSVAGYKYLNFGTGVEEGKFMQLELELAPKGTPGRIDIYIDKPNDTEGIKIGNLNVDGKSGEFGTYTADVENVTGKHALYLVFSSSGGGEICEINKFQFVNGENLIDDDFTGDSDAWITTGSPNISDGAAILSTGDQLVSKSGEGWENYLVTAEVEAGDIALQLRRADDNNYYVVTVEGDDIVLSSVVNGIKNELVRAPLGIKAPYTLQARSFEDQIAVYVNGTALLVAKDSDHTAGGICLGAADDSVTISNIRAQIVYDSENVKPYQILIDGKPLEGFSVGNNEYYIKLDGEDIPKVTAFSGDNTVGTKVTQAGAIPGAASVEFESISRSDTYTINFYGGDSVFDFKNLSELPVGWSIVNPKDADDNITFGEDGITISTTYFDGIDKVENQLQYNIPLVDDWMVETHTTLSRPISRNYEQFGMFVRVDDNNYIRVNVEGNTSKIQVLWVKDGGYVHDSPAVSASGEEDFYLRLKKTGTKIELYYSFDGEEYKLLGSEEMDNRFDDGACLRLYATSQSGGNPSYDATFEYCNIIGGTGEAPTEYEVTVNGGTGSGDYAVGEEVTVTAEVPDDNTFVSWTATGIVLDDNTKEEITFIMPANDVTLTANFEPVEATKYTVTFVADDKNVETKTVEEGGTLAAADFPDVPIKPGYDGEWDVIDDIENIASDITVNAVYTPQEYTVTLDVNGGNDLVKDTILVTYGEHYDDLPVPTHDYEYTFFNGWYTALEDGELVLKNTPVTATEDHTLFALWRDAETSALPNAIVRGMPAKVTLPYEGDGIELSVDDEDTYTYQWQRHTGEVLDDWEDLDDEIECIYIIPVSDITEAANGWQYRCVVTNKEDGKKPNQVNSSAVTLVVENDIPDETSVTGVSLDKSSINLYSNQGARTAKLTATVHPSDADNKSVFWSSSNDSVATVDQTGLVTVHNNGTAIITVTTIEGGFTDNCTVTVTSYKSSGGGGGGGGGGGESSTVDSVAVARTTNGSISISSMSPTKDEKVIITITPDEGYDLDSLTITDINGETLSYTDNGDGTYTFTYGESAVTINAVFVKITEIDPGDVPLGPGPWNNPFKDVSTSDWFYDDVGYVYKNGYMTGVDDTTFAPQAKLSRAMLVTMLWRIEGEPEPTGANPFTDLTHDWYKKAVIWASENKIVEGYGGGRFGPSDDITREQMAAILYNYSEYKGYDVSARAELGGYTDANKISSWALDAMRWANAEGLINGRSETELAPRGTATRAEAAAVLHRYLEKFDEEPDETE